jgi:GNAT superfamily N-acetyltransferase
LTGHLGLAHFDNGDFGRAEPLLRSSYESALTAGPPSTAQTMANYFAQLLMTCGRFEEAEELLQSALAMADTSKASYHKGYNLALLGKLYLEWDRPEEAEKPILAGWHQTMVAGNLSLIPLVRNYLGELYLCARYRGRDIRRAAALFRETVAECQRTGFQRSEIAALALEAHTALQAQDIDRAMACSAAAVRRLDEVGTMPALRTEEIYLTRYQVLMAVNRHTEAQHWIDKARTTLEAKAATIPDSDLRRIFCTRVQTSRAILAIA